MMKRFSAAALLLLVSTAAYAQEAESGSAPAEEADPSIVIEGEKEKKICKSVASTGSIMPRRVCKTQSQLDREQADSRRMIDEERNRREAQQQAQRSRQMGG